MGDQFNQLYNHSSVDNWIGKLEGNLPRVNRPIDLTPAWSRTLPLENLVVPTWVYDAVFYQIYPDRFAISGEYLTPERTTEWRNAPQGNYFLGGDLWGAAEKLGQLSDLGITAIYLNPVFLSNEAHRYSTVDYKEVDPRLGGRAAFDAFINRAHALGLKVVLDGVFNHCGIDSPQFRDVLQYGRRSEYFEWFRFHDVTWLEGRADRRALSVGYPDSQALRGYCYECWSGVPTLPVFNHRNVNVREFIYEIGRYWIAAGADGWRLDVADRIKDHSLLREFRCSVREVNPDAYIVGEIWHKANRWLNSSDQLDAVMNYMLAKNILELVMKDQPPTEILADSNYKYLKPQPMDEIFRKMQRILRRYPAQHVLAQLNELGSHDTPRIFSILRQDQAALKMAHTINFIMPGVPCIYYGDELMLSGGHDPGCRAPFPLEIRDEQYQMRKFIQQLIAVRRNANALCRGNVALYKGDHEDIAAVARYTDNELVLAFINRGDDEQVVNLNLMGNLSRFEDHKMSRAALNHVSVPRELNDLLDNAPEDFLAPEGNRIRGVRVPGRSVQLYGGRL